jgi:hypothetical protein
MPYTLWSVSGQQIVNVLVYNNPDFTGAPIASNNGGGTLDPIQEFSFIYASSYGDLYISVTTGNAGNIVYTMTLEFGPKPTRTTLVPDAPRTAVETPQTLSKSAAVIILQQIIADSDVYTVVTGSSVLIDFSYCPSQATYNMIIQITATDEKTATSLYVCLPDQIPCDASKATREHSDPRPIAVNTVSLSTTSTEFSALQVAVYGWGDYQQDNKFIFSVNVVT